VYNTITITTEKIFHKIDSIWKNYYIIKFPWNKYYSGRNISLMTKIFIIVCENDIITIEYIILTCGNNIITDEDDVNTLWK
jgi:hypothetical protein